MHYRLVKPDWGKPKIKGTENPAFQKEISGPNILEGNFDDAFLKQKNTEGYNIYYFPNHPSKIPEDRQFLNGKDIDVFRYAFVDMDLKDGTYKSKEAFLRTIKNFAVKPSIVVDSGNGIHVYWKITNLTRLKYMYAQCALIKHFETDTSVWTTLQLMRMWGYNNTKDPNNLKLAIKKEEYSSDQEYDIGILLKELPTPDKKDIQKIETHDKKLRGEYVIPELEQDIDKLPRRFQKLLECWTLFSDPAGAMGGDRSRADMSLCNKLHHLGFSRKEVLPVMCNTHKALSRITDRYDYAYNIVDKVYTSNASGAIPSVREWKKQRKVTCLERINGSHTFDNFERGWSKGDVLGLIAGTGVGKTAFSLKIIKDLIDSNPDKDDIYFFFTLEMPERQIIERWDMLTRGKDQYLDRFFVFGNDAIGNNVRLGPQQIYEKVTQTCKLWNKQPGVIVLDHFQVLNKSIDMRIEPNFGIEADLDSGKGNVRTMKPETMCRVIKDLAVKLDCFLVVQNQTTKVKSGQGDLPLDVSAAYGTAHFEWACDFLITLWQPIIRVQDEYDLCITGWQYCKIREKRPKDVLTKGKYYWLSFDMVTGDFRSVTADEASLAERALEEANELKKKEAKNELPMKYSDPHEVDKMAAAIKEYAEKCSSK